MEDTRRRGSERREREEEDAGKVRFNEGRGDERKPGRYRRGGDSDSGSPDLDARHRCNRRASERDARDKEKDPERSNSSDFEAMRRGNRRGGGRDEREKDGGRWRGSERRKRDQEEEPRRRLDEGEDGSRRRRDEKSDSGSSDEEIGKKRSERRDKELPRKRTDDGENNGRWKYGSESSGEEMGTKRGESPEEDQRRNRLDDRDKNVYWKNDMEISGKERDRKRSEKLEQEKPSQRLNEEEAGDGKRRDDRVRNGRQGSDLESSGEEKDRRSEGRKKEQHRKRLDDKDEDEKNALTERRHGQRRDERNSRHGRPGSESESSDEAGRRRDRDRRDRRRRERERRRHRYDSDDSSDSGGRRKGHSRQRSDHREDRARNQRHDMEDGDTGSRRERNEKASESKQEGKDGKGEEAVVRPPTQSAIPNLNPSGDLGTLGRTGGVYIPPFKLARMMKEIEDKSSPEYQRLTWDALRKSINGLVNKVNATNIKNIIPELLGENLIRGRGLFCRSCMKSQMASPGFTDVFAALVAVVNTKFPEIGDLLLRRIILQLKRAYKRNDKPQLMAAVKFIAHLVNQQVAHELVALELLTILLEQPTDDSVEVAVDFVKECGSILQDLCPKGLHGIFERFRGILHEGEIDKRVQFLIEGLFAIRKAKFQGHPAVRPELDLVDPEDQLTHEVSLEDEIDPETGLDIFKQDPNFLENEKRYEELKKSILGDESEDEEESDAESDDDEDDEEEDDDDDEQQMQIQDETETNLINLRRTIYLTIMSSVDFEEAGHKLLKIKLEPGQEMELNIMLLECCSQERTYLRYYGLLGQRFCMLNKVYQENFDKCFVQQYSMIHRLETNKLRNVAKFFAHLLGTDALPWHVLAYIRLTEEDTTSSSRIFIKILFQELSEHLGIRLLNERLNDPAMLGSFDSIFPKDNPRNTRFAINFFTSIGLGGITENLREYLKNMPRMIMQQQKPESDDESGSGPSGSSSSGSESSSDESDSNSDSSSSSSDESDRDRRKKRKKDESGGGRHRKRRKGD